MRLIRADEDPVCGMTVNIEQSREKGLTAEHDGREYGFCGRGCLLEFSDDPGRYLTADYRPSM
jgi:YHS domain-containing protein